MLIVEDDEDTRVALRELIREHGYHVAEAVNGREALRDLSLGRSPCLILLDIRMPVMNGLEFLRKLRAEKAFDALPVLVLTATPQALPDGAQELLVKPRGIEAIVGIVDRYCEQHRRPRPAANA
ncbi:MAG: hypothetical protein NVSMB23_03340 [Myxococcales bacterium]